MDPLGLGGGAGAAIDAFERTLPAAATVGAQDGTAGVADTAEHERIPGSAVAKRQPEHEQPVPGYVSPWSCR
jgi:hypothetical protein